MSSHDNSTNQPDNSFALKIFPLTLNDPEIYPMSTPQNSDSKRPQGEGGIPQSEEGLIFLMSFAADIPRCQHVKVNGVQCGSPALRHKRFCYFHHSWREVSSPSSRARARAHSNAEGAETPITNLPPLEDANSIQMALMQVMRLIVTRQIDGKLAGLLLYALQTATSNLKQLTLEPDWKKVVVNPAAVRYSPLDRSGESAQQLSQEDELLFERMQSGAAEGPEDAKAKTKQRPCATAAAAISQVMRSRHTLPTSPEDWDALKETDSSAWLMAMAALTYPREMWQEIREHPEKFGAEDPKKSKPS